MKLLIVFFFAFIAMAYSMPQPQFSDIIKNAGNAFSAAGSAISGINISSITINFNIKFCVLLVR